MENIILAVITGFYFVLTTALALGFATRSDLDISKALLVAELSAQHSVPRHDVNLRAGSAQSHH